MTSGEAASADAASAAPAAGTSSGDFTTATASSPRVTTVNLSPRLRSRTNSVWSRPREATSTSNFSTMSDGRHSTSTMRSTCSRTPPPSFTPVGSPTSVIGTVTRTFSVSDTSLKSTCIGVPARTSFCISRRSAGTSLPSMSSVTSSCLPVLPRMAIMKSWHGHFMSSVPPFFIFITEPGIIPARRRRRTAAVPCSVRASALILI